MASQVVCKPQKPAPQFSATAVVDGQFQKVSLSDYKGTSFTSVFIRSELICNRQVCCVVLLPVGLHLRLPDRDHCLQRSREGADEMKMGDRDLIICFQEFRDINCEVIACSCDSEYSHLAWVNTPRKEGGLGQMNIPLVADFTKQIARDYNVLVEDEGLSLRCVFFSV